MHCNCQKLSIAIHLKKWCLDASLRWRRASCSAAGGAEHLSVCLDLCCFYACAQCIHEQMCADEKDYTHYVQCNTYWCIHINSTSLLILNTIERGQKKIFLPLFWLASPPEKLLTVFLPWHIISSASWKLDTVREIMHVAEWIRPGGFCSER